MEVYHSAQIKIRRIPLPTIHPETKDQKSDSRFKIASRNANDSPNKYTTEMDENSTMSEETFLQDLSDNENRGSCTSIGDLPPTSDSSKNSLMPINQCHRKKSAKTKGLDKMEQGYKIPARRMKSQNGTSGKGSYNKQASNVDKVTSELKGLFKEIKLPKVSAKCWAVMNGKTGEMLFTKKGVKRREIASLTKMMTLLCVCKLIKQYGIDPKSIYIQVSKYAASMGGTSADLEKDDILSIWDLMHGLMLPSGNDAAVSLAESFGTYIYLKSDKCKAKMKQDPDHANKQVKDPIRYFLYLMNKTAADLELKNTYYANPHGLVNTDSYSTACDQAKLTYHLLKWDMIREIVNKKEYRCEVEQEDQSIRNVCWENTNKLLGRRGWQGVKTGVTSAAGPSLSAYYEDEKDSYIVILLSSATMDIRWIEAMKLVNWSLKHKKDRPILM